MFQKIPMDCPTIIIGDFNIDMLTNTLQSMEQQTFTNKYCLQLVFFCQLWFITLKSITYGPMHEYNNGILNQLKLIGQIIKTHTHCI
jgi:hypothetical protein